MNENAVERLSIALLEQGGWGNAFPGSETAPDGKNTHRRGYQEVLLSDSLRSALRRLNPSLPGTALEDAFRQVERIHAPELMAGNQAFHALLTEGGKATVRRNDLDRGEIVWLVDFN